MFFNVMGIFITTLILFKTPEDETLNPKPNLTHRVWDRICHLFGSLVQLVEQPEQRPFKQPENSVEGLEPQKHRGYKRQSRGVLKESRSAKSPDVFAH